MADKDEQLDTTDQHRTPPDVQMRGRSNENSPIADVSKGKKRKHDAIEGQDAADGDHQNKKLKTGFNAALFKRVMAAAKLRALEYLEQSGQRLQEELTMLQRAQIPNDDDVATVGICESIKDIEALIACITDLSNPNNPFA